MLCAVYSKFYRGQERDRESVRRSPALGDLRFTTSHYDPRPWRVEWRASLLASDGETYVRPVLDKAQIVRVAAGGILIEGTEVVPLHSTGIKNVKTARYPQAWWCVPRLR